MLLDVHYQTIIMHQSLFLLQTIVRIRYMYVHGATRFTPTSISRCLTLIESIVVNLVKAVYPPNLKRLM